MVNSKSSPGAKFIHLNQLPLEFSGGSVVFTRSPSSFSWVSGGLEFRTGQGSNNFTQPLLVPEDDLDLLLQFDANPQKVKQTYRYSDGQVGWLATHDENHPMGSKKFRKVKSPKKKNTKFPEFGIHS